MLDKQHCVFYKLYIEITGLFRAEGARGIWVTSLFSYKM
jgi:hypothetical protein